MTEPSYSDRFLRNVLASNKRIAIVGVSSKTVRPSWFVGNYLNRRGYKIIPINPGLAGGTLFDQDAYASLSDIPTSEDPVEMVDIFRRSDQVIPIVEEAIDTLKDRGLKSIWMQIGVINHEAAEIAEAAGLSVVMNRCPKMEYQRLMGELSWGGVNSGILSSRMR